MDKIPTIKVTRDHMVPVKRDDGWWLTNMPEGGECGPYDTRAEMMEDRKGMKAFYRYLNDEKHWNGG